jgi:hypothetical protein
MGADAAGIDVLVTWLGATGALSYLVHIVRNPSRSPLERRAVFLLGVLAALLTVRGFAWLRMDDALLKRAVFAAATLLPLAMALFTEGLLRRHLPLAAKLLAAGSSALFFALNLAPEALRGPAITRAFPVALVGVMAMLGWFLLTRRRATLSPTENRLVSGCLLAVLAGLPLAASDFRLELGFPSQRWGAVGVLLFVYTLARMARAPEGAGGPASDFGWIAAKALLLAGLAALLWPGEVEAFGRALPLAVALALLFAVWERLRAQSAAEGEAGLLRWLARAPTDSLDAFAAWLRRYPLTEQHLILGPAELRAYRAESLARLFQGGSTLCSAARLRRTGAGAPREELDAAEQMADVLERHEMTHACLLGVEPLRLLLVHLPEITGSRDAELELEVIGHQASLALARETARA